MDGVKALEAMTAGIIARLENMPPVDVARLRAEYRAAHADEIAAHKKYMADMRAVCRIFEK